MCAKGLGEHDSKLAVRFAAHTMAVQKSTIRSVTFISVPCHAGVRGNERAKLACLATIFEGQPLGVHIINNLKDTGRVVDFLGSESTSMSRLHGLGVKIGIARNERCSSRARGF